MAIRTQASEWTYTDVAASANRTGNAFRELGVEMESRVLMAVLDSPEFAATFFGTIKLGAVPVNTNLSSDEYAYLLNDSRARIAVVSEPLADAFRKARRQSSYLRHLVVIGETAPGELSFEEITRDAEKKLSPADTTNDDSCFWLYSSGSTGQPKGVVHLQHAMRSCVEAYAKPVLGIDDSDITFSASKLYFAYGLGNGLYFPFAAGSEDESVVECAVVGMPDHDSLVKPEAFVVLAGGEQELEDRLRQRVRQRLGGNKTPRAFHFVESLPKTATGKVQRFKLRELTQQI